MFSQDHDGMFPSLHIPTVCQIAADDFCNSNLELEDVVELLLYLTIVLDRQHLNDFDLGGVTYKMQKPFSTIQCCQVLFGYQCQGDG